MTVDQFHLRVRRHHVDPIRHDARAFGRFDHWKRRVACQQKGERAGMMRRQVLHENNREIGRGRQTLQKLGKCFEASGRRADADDREVMRWMRCNNRPSIIR